jgi:hypothetical protein
MAWNLAQGLQSWAGTRRDIVVYDLSAKACPLSRGGKRRFSDGSDWPIDPQCAWWSDPGSPRSVDLAQFRPDIVVMQDGMDEVVDRKLPQWPDWRHAGQPLFDQWLLSEYTAAIKTFRSQGAKLLALNAVCVDWETLASGDSSWSGYAQNGDGDSRTGNLDRDNQVLAADAQVVDYNSEICPGGKFSTTVAGVPNARPDGYHLIPAASTALAAQWLGPLVFQAGGRGH